VVTTQCRGIMNGFEKRREQKKADVLKAALGLFQSYGFKKVSINEIASSAGVSPVTIYNHFGSKDGLVRECVVTFLNGLMQKYQDIMQSDQPFAEKLELIVLDKTDIVSQFHGELTQTALRLDPGYIESIWQNQIGQVTMDFFEEGKRQGAISPEISNEALQIYLEIIRKGIAASSVMQLDMARHPQMLRDLIRVMTYGLNG